MEEKASVHTHKLNDDCLGDVVTPVLNSTGKKEWEVSLVVVKTLLAWGQSSFLDVLLESMDYWSFNLE